jgi:hypothetical protein
LSRKVDGTSERESKDSVCDGEVLELHVCSCVKCFLGFRFVGLKKVVVKCVDECAMLWLDMLTGEGVWVYFYRFLLDSTLF